MLSRARLRRSSTRPAVDDATPIDRDVEVAASSPSRTARGRSSCARGRPSRRRTRARRTCAAVPWLAHRRLLVFSSCPPNSLRMAERSLSAKSASPRDVNRAYSARRQHVGRARLRRSAAMHRPAALAGVGHPALEVGEVGDFAQRVRGEVEQPRRDDAAPPPHLGDLGDVEVVLVVLADRAAARSRRRPRCLRLADVGVAAGCSGPRRTRP